MTITEHMVNAKCGTKITNGPRVQMQTAGSKKKEDWTEVSKEQLAEVKLPASFENWMMSGTPNRNIETRYLNYLHTVDPDLYHVAMRKVSEVRTYGFMEDLHQQGILSDSQNQYDMSLLGMLFGKDADSMRMLLHGCKESGNFLELLDCIARMEQNRWISFGNSNISTVELFNIASFMTGYG